MWYSVNPGTWKLKNNWKLLCIEWNYELNKIFKDTRDLSWAIIKINIPGLVGSVGPLVGPPSEGPVNKDRLVWLI